MKTTLSVVKADIGSIGGHICPSQRLLDAVTSHVREHGRDLLLSPGMTDGFRFVIMDVEHTEGDKIIELNAPEDLYDIATLLRATEPVDAFEHPFWDKVRDSVSDKAMEMRRQGFFGAAMLPISELEYTGIMEKLEELDEKFQVRDPTTHARAP